MIHAKNHLARTLRQADHDHEEATKLLDELVQLKLRIKESITDLKVQKRNRLRTKILRADPTRRRFWRFIKSQTKAAGTISAINKVSYIPQKYDIIMLKNPNFHIHRTRKWYLSNQRSRRPFSNTLGQFSKAKESQFSPRTLMLTKLRLPFRNLTKSCPAKPLSSGKTSSRLKLALPTLSLSLSRSWILSLQEKQQELMAYPMSCYDTPVSTPDCTSKLS